MNLTTETTVPSRRAVPLRLQILVWAFLAGFLALVGIGLVRAQQGTVQPGYEVPDFNLTLFSGYEYNDKAEIKILDLRRQGHPHQFLGFVVQALRAGGRSIGGSLEVLSAHRKSVFS